MFLLKCLKILKLNSGTVNIKSLLLFKNLLNLLGWHWLIKLHRLQVHNSIIHLCVVLSVHNPNSFHHHVAPLALFYLLPRPYPAFPLVITDYCLCWVLFCFVVCLISSLFFTPSSLTAVSLFSIYESVFLLVYLVQKAFYSVMYWEKATKK